MKRVTKPRPAKAIVAKSGKKIPAAQARTLFTKGNKAATGHGPPKHRRYITMGFIDHLEKQVERTISDVKNGKSIKKKELTTNRQIWLEALFKACVVDRNPAAMRMVLEMIEGKTPQDINVVRKSFEITADMDLEQASRVYLEHIKEGFYEDSEE